MAEIEDIVKDAYGVKDFDWKPLYPNNMPCNGLMGYYAVKLHELEEGVLSGRKYTILFQCEMDEDGITLENAGVEYYVLFEKCYDEIVGLGVHPAPSDNVSMFSTHEGGTLNALEVNGYGRFCYVCKTLEQAKRLAVMNYQMVFGYALSHLL